MADSEGRKTGGRVKGTPNKSTQELQALADEMGVNPFKILLLFASGDFDALGLEKMTMKAYGENVNYELTISPELQQKSAKDACEYLFAKRKAVEHSGANGEPIQTVEEFIAATLGKK